MTLPTIIIFFVVFVKKCQTMEFQISEMGPVQRPTLKFLLLNLQ